VPTVSYGITNTADDVSDATSAGGGVDNTSVLQGLLFGTYSVPAGLRFLAVAVPQGATITAATLTLKKDASQPYISTNHGSLKGVASDNAPAWATTRPALAAKTTQSVSVVNSATVAYDVAAIVQVIVNRAGWVSGNALAFAGDTAGANGAITWVDYSTSATNCAQLSITYTTGGGGSSYAIAGAASGSAATAASPKRSAPSAGAVTATAASAGSGSVARAITGSSISAGSVSGQLLTLRPAAATVLASAIATGDVEREAGAYSISGTAAALVFSLADVGREAPCAATSSAISTSSANVIGSRPLSAVSVVAGQCQGDFEIGSPLSASATVIGTTSGAVLRLATIDGQSVGQGLASGAYSRVAPVGAAVDGVGYASGDLTASIANDGGGQAVWRRRRGSSVR